MNQKKKKVFKDRSLFAGIQEVLAKHEKLCVPICMSASIVLPQDILLTGAVHLSVLLASCLLRSRSRSLALIVMREVCQCVITTLLYINCWDFSTISLNGQLTLPSNGEGV